MMLCDHWMPAMLHTDCFLPLWLCVQPGDDSAPAPVEDEEDGMI